MSQSQKETFFRLYAETGNATEAYRLAFPVESVGLSDIALRSRAFRLAKNATQQPDVAQHPSQNATPTATQQPDVAQRPSQNATPTATQQSDVAQRPPQTATPTATQQPDVAQRRSKTATPTATQQPDVAQRQPLTATQHQDSAQHQVVAKNNQSQQPTVIIAWEILNQFKEAMTAHGLIPPAQILADGLLHRCDAGGVHGKGDGAYILFLDDCPAGGMQDWRDDRGWINWRANIGRAYTPEEEKKYRAKVAEMRRKKEEEVANQHQRVQQQAVALWEAADEASANRHPYLERKGVGAHGVRINAATWKRQKIPATLLIPLRDWEGTLWSLQVIFPAKDLELDRDRDFMFEGRKTGLFHRLGRIDDHAPLLVAEGYATGATLHELTGWPVLVAFDSGNLKPVALEARKRHPTIDLVLAADNDRFTLGNPGLGKANEAALLAKARVVFPHFEEHETGSDWNDWAGLRESHEALGAEMAALFARPVPGTRTIANEKPVIMISGASHPQNVIDAENVIINHAGEEIFQRGGMLIRLAKIPNPNMSLQNYDSQNDPSKHKKVERADNSLTVVPVDPLVMDMVLTTHAVFKKFNGRNKTWETVNCPSDISNSLLRKVGYWRIRNLVGIIEAPTLRTDGSILETPGYDNATGLFFDDGGVEFPKIPTHPSKADASRALKELLEIVCEFKFKSDANESAAIAAIMSVLIRRSIGNSPLYGFSAPKMGSGKSLLSDVAAIMATGRRATMMSHSTDHIEEKKRILAVLLAGDSVAVVDNISGPFASDTLCAVLTSDTYKDRVLGETRMVAVPTSITWMATGNNLEVAGDLSTRTILIQIDPDVERPDERKFSKELIKWIPQHRPRLVVAALTIMRAFIVAGKPKGELSEYNRFQEWSDMVRAPLVWLGMADPLKTREEIERNDPIRVQLSALFTAWSDFIGPDEITVSELVFRAKQLANPPTNRYDPDRSELPEKNPSLLNALLDVAGDKGEINSWKLGNWLRRYEGRIEAGFKIERNAAKKSNDGGMLWTVKSGVSRVSRVSPLPHGENGRVKGTDTIVHDDAHAISHEGLGGNSENYANSVDEFDEVIFQ